MNYKSNQEKADDAKYKLGFNQARVQFNQQRLQGEHVDYLTPFKDNRVRASKKELTEIVWSEYVKKSMVKQVKATK